ncbi:hypothetical protein JQ633_03750 [Bradyrhizobium tropiciagri]|uniref:hypothetical protein n=1 Tax=Bradyrhizobium tropiciagri TaxID=312253 RepID=UPI001BAA0097|nr:hypothetical protein [Bradyrhizobium tropiciagri]MBR0869460.1 hypothetical protein [Bradyrhizobium tropiciagri]
MNGEAGQTRRRFFVIFQLLKRMFLPTARQKLPRRDGAGKTSRWLEAVVEHRPGIPRKRSSRRKTLLSHQLTRREQMHAHRHAVIHSRRGRDLAFDDCDWAIFSESPFRRYRIF